MRRGRGRVCTEHALICGDVKGSMILSVQTMIKLPGIEARRDSGKKEARLSAGESVREESAGGGRSPKRAQAKGWMKGDRRVKEAAQVADAPFGGWRGWVRQTRSWEVGAQVASEEERIEVSGGTRALAEGMRRIKEKEQR